MDSPQFESTAFLCWDSYPIAWPRNGDILDYGKVYRNKLTEDLPPFSFAAPALKKKDVRIFLSTIKLHPACNHVAKMFFKNALGFEHIADQFTDNKTAIKLINYVINFLINDKMIHVDIRKFIDANLSRTQFNDVEKSTYATNISRPYLYHMENGCFIVNHDLSYTFKPFTDNSNFDRLTEINYDELFIKMDKNIDIRDKLTFLKKCQNVDKLKFIISLFVDEFVVRRIFYPKNNYNVGDTYVSLFKECKLPLRGYRFILKQISYNRRLNDDAIMQIAKTIGLKSTNFDTEIFKLLLLRTNVVELLTYCSFPFAKIDIQKYMNYEFEDLPEYIQKIYYLSLKLLDNTVEVPIVTKWKQDVDYYLNPTIEREYWLSVINAKAVRHNCRVWATKNLIMYQNTDKPYRIKKDGEWILSEKLVAYRDATGGSVNYIGSNILYVIEENYASTLEVDMKKPALLKRHCILKDNESLLRVAIHDDDPVPDDLKELIIKVFSGEWLSLYELQTLITSSQKIYVDWYNLEIENIEYLYLFYGMIFNSNSIPIKKIGTDIPRQIFPIILLMRHLYGNIIIHEETIIFRVAAHMIYALDQILEKHSRKHFMIDYKPNIEIVTPLWRHQINNTNTILEAFRNGSRGFGDASDVGSGKTLISLNIAKHLIDEFSDNIHSGILVLVPNYNLVRSWITEIKKHTTGFKIIDYDSCKGHPIKIYPDTIVISTLNANKTYPSRRKWLFTVIDECLCIKDKNAQTTKEARYQAFNSKFTLLLSATFFQSSEKELTDMMTITRTVIPNDAKYADLMILEKVTSSMAVDRREFIENVHNYFDKQQKQKSHINFRSDPTITAKILGQVMNSLPQDRMCVLYANSENEAKVWSKEFNIPIFVADDDNISSYKHIITTTKKGTVGLNSLVKFNTIVTRPPTPDKITQLKGRLDRPGQEHPQLYMEYLIIDRADFIAHKNLNKALKFVNESIKPIAEHFTVTGEEEEDDSEAEDIEY